MGTTDHLSPAFVLRESPRGQAMRAQDLCDGRAAGSSGVPLARDFRTRSVSWWTAVHEKAVETAVPGGSDALDTAVGRTDQSEQQRAERPDGLLIHHLSSDDRYEAQREESQGAQPPPGPATRRWGLRILGGGHRVSP
jgi:hypothetical protein